MKAIVDSVIFIDHFNGWTAATNFLLNNRAILCITPITRAEVLAGCNEKAWQNTSHLLGKFEFVPFDAAICDEAARLRKLRLKLPDAFQLATARLYNRRLATRNAKDFSTARFPQVWVPYVSLH